METKNCQNCKNEFIIEPQDAVFYEQIKSPVPTWCPKCRMIRRLGWRGYRTLYKRKCDKTGESLISVHHEGVPFKVWKQDIWWGDSWDPKSFGKEYDFSKSFFEQWNALFRDVPLPALYTSYTTMVRSEYCNAAAGVKDCYLCFNADNAENSSYLNTITDIKDSLDLSFCYHTTLSYDSLNCNKCYRTFFSEDCQESQDVYFSKDMIGCSNCIGCCGLRKKEYCVYNKQVSKEEFEKTLKELRLDTAEGIQKARSEAKKVWLEMPVKFYHGRKISNSTGDYLLNCENVTDTYFAGDTKNIRYAQFIGKGPSVNCYDYSHFALNSEWIYESCWVGIQSNNVRFGFWNYTAYDLEYCFGCHSSKNCFGCVGLRSAQYCILNKQYTKEEYEKIVPQIRRQMQEMPFVDSKGHTYSYGEFFPPEFSPWSYNESNMSEWIPLEREEAEVFGFTWKEKDTKEYQAANYVIPESVLDVGNDITQAILACELCGKNYRLIQSELAFYKRMNFAIPRQCFFCRDNRRILSLNPIELYMRSCMCETIGHEHEGKCFNEFKTTYSPNRPEVVYCESCYQKEVM